MKAEIFSIGTEMLLGEIVDTNSRYVASRLPALGVDVYYQHTVGDNLDRILETFQHAAERSDLLITTGGLGPTEDDLTREAISALFGEEMAIDERLEQTLRAWFEGRNYHMPERNLKQATLIPSARTIPNPFGTAPGWWAEKNGVTVIAMPGPPSEMTRMWQSEVEPELLKRGGGMVLATRTLKTSGIGEGTLDEMISPLLKSTNPSIGVYARADGVHVRVGAKARTREEAIDLIRPMEEELRLIVGPSIWGTDDETFEAAVGRMLRELGMTVATMESFTGGLLASTLTDVAGSSEYFKGGYVSYQTEIKESLGIDHAIVEEFGVVSDECAKAMATLARERFGANIGVGTTGVAGPDMQEDKEVGTSFIAIDTGHGEPQVSTYVFPHSRDAIKRRAVTSALFIVRRALLAMDA
jgi:nicotinamide-nucleotide amidase